MKDTLFVLTPDFTDKGDRYFCPFSAQVIGFLTYYAQIRTTVNVVELGFEKPRKPLSDLLGEEHQSAPMLVLGDEAVAVAGVTIAEENGHKYIEKTIQILRYLATTRNVALPH
ncbi:MAG: DUF3088 family protein [Deltaproteobacteria bacterium]|nr:DUF3088 family protein [Deltaproteobacteria bacterium]